MCAELWSKPRVEKIVVYMLRGSLYLNCSKGKELVGVDGNCLAFVGTMMCH
jgi:hypothetical protein